MQPSAPKSLNLNIFIVYPHIYINTNAIVIKLKIKENESTKTKFPTCTLKYKETIPSCLPSKPPIEPWEQQSCTNVEVRNS